MCGRYSMSTPPQQIAMRFQAQLPAEELQEHFNAAPGQQLPVVLAGDEGRRLELFRWGLIPSWAKDANIGYKMINARAESVEEKPAFRTAFKRRRCLVPADGFYEWYAAGKHKQPVRFVLTSDEPFAIAGLWDEWHDPQGQLVRSFTIITGAPNELVAPIHDRMPVILSQEHEALWLDQQAGPHVWLDLLKPYPAELMRSYEVSQRLNSPTNNDASLLQPV